MEVLARGVGRGAGVPAVAVVAAVEVAEAAAAAVAAVAVAVAVAVGAMATRTRAMDLQVAATAKATAMPHQAQMPQAVAGARLRPPWLPLMEDRHQHPLQPPQSPQRHLACHLLSPPRALLGQTRRRRRRCPPSSASRSRPPRMKDRPTWGRITRWFPSMGG